MIRNISKPRFRSWIPRGGLELLPDRDFDQEDWVEHMSERAARAAAWRRKQREKRKQHRDQSTDH